MSESSGLTPEQIQRQIEDTRAELASTVEQIADRVSPKKVAGRGAAAAREKAEEVFAKDVPADGPGEHGTSKEVRWERVGAVAAGLLLLLLARRGGKKRKVAAPRKAALKAAAEAAAKARKEYEAQVRAEQKAQAQALAKQEKARARGRPTPPATSPRRRGSKAPTRADRTRAEIEAAIVDLRHALDLQPGGQ